MNDVIIQLLGTCAAAAAGGVAAWVAIRVDVAVAKNTAERADASSARAHTRIDDHVDRHHTRGQGTNHGI